MNDFDASSEFLAVILSPYSAPRIIKLSAAEMVAPSVHLTDADYVDSGAGDWLGFYDWLRTPRGEVIGVQQWIDEASAFPFSTKFEGVEASVKRDVLRIYFGQSRDVDEANSCDQDFGRNRLLIAGKSVALTFQGPWRQRPYTEGA
jgi:hypothetical protein